MGSPKNRHPGMGQGYRNGSALCARLDRAKSSPHLYKMCGKSYYSSLSLVLSFTDQMAPIRTSNLERGKWRSKCREQLSKYIRKTSPASSSTITNTTPESRIGITIEPSQVRLIPGADDPYSWKVLPEKKYLFSKHMSDHSISAYKELCGGIGFSFEAVPVETTRTGTGSEDIAQEVFTSAEVYKHLEFLIPANHLFSLHNSASARK